MEEASFYTPREDTFLLEDALRSDVQKNLRLIVEVGCGSGYLSKVLREIYPSSYVISTDISPFAASETNSLLSGCNGDVVRTSITDGIRAQIDLAVFNPPYVPSEKVQGLQWIDRSWAGGEDGLEVISLFLEQTKDIPLRYLLVTCFNHPKELFSCLSKNYETEILNSKKIQGEHLFVLRIKKP